MIKVPFLFEKVKVVNVNMSMTELPILIFFYCTVLGIYITKKYLTFVNLADIWYLIAIIVRLYLN